MTDWSTPLDSPSSPTPSSGLSAVTAAVEEAGAVGFIHVGRRHDADRRYLTRVDGPDRETGLVYLPGDKNTEPVAIYCVPTDTVRAVADFEQELADGIARRIEAHDPSTATGRAIRSRLDDRVDGTGRLLVPRTLPHDTAVVLQQAGYELQSTAAVTAGRGIKTATERDCLRAVQRAAAAGLARGEAVLAGSESTSDRTLAADGRPLTTARLRRLVDAELVSCGVSPADNTVVDAATEPTAPLSAGDPIRLTVAPRGPHGYHGRLTTTVAVDSDGGWDRRAFIAAEAGLTAARRHIEPGVDASVIAAEAMAEIGAYGFAVAVDSDEPTKPRVTATVNGIGLSTYESPTVDLESELRAGSVIAVETGVVDAERGTVRLGNVFAVSGADTESLVTYPLSLTPADRTN